MRWLALMISFYFALSAMPALSAVIHQDCHQSKQTHDQQHKDPSKTSRTPSKPHHCMSCFSTPLLILSPITFVLTTIDSHNSTAPSKLITQVILERPLRPPLS
ncbi:MAG: hypothetical protein ACK5RO_07015 [Pseudobdellovibrionaceae bacterium]